MIGIFAALGAAYAGTLATFLFREQTKYFSAIQINFIKSLIAFIVFSPVLFTINIFSNYNNIIFLVISGFIGISIGDSFYLNALKRIGTRRTLTIEALSPILANILGSLLINESISLQGWIGTIIVSLSLFGISLEKIVGNNFDQSQEKFYGFLYAIISVLCTVIASILARIVLVNSDLNPLQSSELRLLGSLLIILLYIRIDIKDIINSIHKKK